MSILVRKVIKKTFKRNVLNITYTKRYFTSLNSANIAIAGVTGAVGIELLDLIKQRNFKFGNIKFLASKRSAGKQMEFMGKTYTVEELNEHSFKDVDITFFSAGGSVSKKYASYAVKAGSYVIDNSSAFRMDDNVPLIVPEINGNELIDYKGIIANPNCSTIIMNMIVYPIYKKYGVKRILMSTYQAASGAGKEAMIELEQQANDYIHGNKMTQNIFGKQYIFNLFSHNSNIDMKTGYNEEELKCIKETKKIFGDNSLKISATCVRVPVLRAHCESINLELLNPYTNIDDIYNILNDAPGVTIVDDKANNVFPEPINASFKDDCFVGRIRQDISQDNGKGLELFVSGDQIRKGAALNAIQIAELLVHQKTKPQ